MWRCTNRGSKTQARWKSRDAGDCLWLASSAQCLLKMYNLMRSPGKCIYKLLNIPCYGKPVQLPWKISAKSQTAPVRNNCCVNALVFYSSNETYRKHFREWYKNDKYAPEYKNKLINTESYFEDLRLVMYFINEQILCFILRLNNHWVIWCWVRK